MKFGKVFFGLIMSLVAAASHAVDVDVSDIGYNRLVFHEPIIKIIAPPGKKLVSEVVYVSENRGVLIDINKQFKQLPLSFQLENGELVDVVLNAKPEIEKPVVWRHKGAADNGGQMEKMETPRPTDEWVIEICRALAERKIPKGFTRVGAPFTKLQLGPITASVVDTYKGYNMTLIAYRLSSEKLISFNPWDFYLEGTVFVMPESDSVGPGLNPILYALVRKEG